MRRFLTNIAIFFAPLIIALLIYEFFLSTIPNTYKFKKQIFESPLDKVEILILGSSRALGGLNPDYFSKPAINLANNSQSLYYDTKLLSFYLDKLPNLKVVIFEMSFYNLFYSLDESREPWRCKFYYKYWGIQPQLSERLWFYDCFYFNLYPLEKIFSIYKKSESFYQTYGNNGYGKDISQLSITQMKAASGRYFSLKDAFYNFDSFYKNIDILNSTIKGLTDSGIQVIFLQYPYYESFSKCIEPEWGVKNDSIFNVWMDKYDVQYYDFSRSIDFSVDLYADVDHVNFKGTELLTKKVDSILYADCLFKKLSKNK